MIMDDKKEDIVPFIRFGLIEVNRNNNNYDHNDELNK